MFKMGLRSWGCTSFLFLSLLMGSAQAHPIIPPEELSIVGIPPLSSEVVAETSRYTEFRPTGFVAWHPTQHEVLVLSRPLEGSTAQLHRVNGPLNPSIQLTSYPDRIASARYEPHQGNYLVFSKDQKGSEIAQNYRYDFLDGTTTLITDGTSKNSLGLWSHRGDQMAYRSNLRNGKDSDFYLINPLEPEKRRRFAEFSQGDSWSIADWSPDDTQILALEYISISESYLWLVQVETGQRTLVTPKIPAEKISHSEPRFSQDGKSIFVITDKDSEFSRLAQIDLKTLHYTYLTQQIDWDVEEFVLSPQGDQIAFLTNEAGSSRLHLLNLNHPLQVSNIDLPTGVISSLEWHPRFNQLAFSLSSAKSPTDVYSYDLDAQKLNRWTDTKTEGIDPTHFIEPKLVTWKSFDGREISGFLYEPSPTLHPGKRPVMVSIHGGPESQYRPGFLGRSNYYLDKLGIALLFPNIRGSSGYGKTFLQLPNGLNRVSAYEDLNSMLDWIKSQENLDGDRIMVTGGSYGGHATLVVATRYNEKIRCAIDIVGMSNLVTFLKNTEPYRQDLRRVIYGDERDEETRVFLESIAPLNHASKITKPLFIIQGEKDPRVPYTEAEQMVKTVQSNGTPVWYLKASNEGHGFSKKPNMDFQFYSTLEFIHRFLIDN